MFTSDKSETFVRSGWWERSSFTAIIATWKILLLESQVESCQKLRGSDLQWQLLCPTVTILDFEDAQLKETKTAGLANFCRFLELWLSAFWRWVAEASTTAWGTLTPAGSSPPRLSVSSVLSSTCLVSANCYGPFSGGNTEGWALTLYPSERSYEDRWWRIQVPLQLSDLWSHISSLGKCWPLEKPL